MASKEAAMGVVFLSQTVCGALGNFFLLRHYLLLSFTGHQLKSTDLILQHLMVANSLSLLSRGVPQTMTAFGLEDFLDDLGCKAVLYLHRVGRGVSVSITCLLSGFQAITIGPRNFRWAKLKVKAPKYTGFCIFMCWTLQILVNIISPIYVTAKWSNRNITLQKDLGFCSANHADTVTLQLYAVLLLFPDVASLSLMIYTSISMLFILYRHRQQVQYIHRINVSSKSSTESRATRRILALVNTFVSSYTLSSIFQVCVSNSQKPSWWLLNIGAFSSLCFPAFCPFVLMIHNSQCPALCLDVRTQSVVRLLLADIQRLSSTHQTVSLPKFVLMLLII
ncbi:PREDICTED: vomeronasal type-1 receptor 4-like [Chinchilla lanigera]|uniref:vomeronasal type-1 receptor 4-like n=1 Tax=Chinchilla lanigera TaxID=34839 RepID=UPI00038EAD78|nr:PREDICTED: vomeronasal type-1 receptor 4-like [Chinchilla lanigera]